MTAILQNKPLMATVKTVLLKLIIKSGGQSVTLTVIALKVKIKPYAQASRFYQKQPKRLFYTFIPVR